MRKITLTPLNNSKWDRWLRDCKKATDDCIKAHECGEKPKITELYKRKSIKDEYFFSKEAPFFGKCAYCETHIPDYQHGDVEHFRPKGGVTDEHDNPVFLKDKDGTIQQDDAGNPIPHPGYYWLAYDWSNLLPSCTKCNQAGTINNKKIGKHMRFPVKGVHAQKPGELPEEQPLLLNPSSTHEDDNPGKHLKIDTATGLFEPLTERGEMCINIFGLNLRDQLVDDRKRAIDQIQNLILTLLCYVDDKENAKKIRTKLNKIKEGKESFTFASLAALRKMKKVIKGV